MKHVLRFLFLCFLSSAVSLPNGWALPVAFKDSTGVMAWYEKERQELQLNYTYNRWFALGPSASRFDLSHVQATAVFFRVNWRALRVNRRASQANLYFTGGGGSWNDDGDSSGAGVFGTEADYETRRLYFSAKGEQIFLEQAQRVQKVIFRTGVAPYLGSFKGLNTWLIMQAAFHSHRLLISSKVPFEGASDHHQSSTPNVPDHVYMYHEGKWVFAPLVRVYYKNVLSEFGADTDGNIIVNFALHY